MLYELSTDVVIECGQRTNNRCGYYGVTLNLSNRANVDFPFSPEVSFLHAKVTDKSNMMHNTSKVWKGGYYADSREAAYVAAMFIIDAVNVDSVIAASGKFDNFPSDLYDLPVNMSLQEAQHIIHNHIEQLDISKKQKADTKKRQSLKNTPIEKVWKELYEQLDLKTLTAKFGRDAIVKARKNLTVSEFEEQFNITLI